MKLFILLFLHFLIVSNLNAQKLEKISLQLQWKDQFQFAGYYIAKEKGFYKEAGLDVELKKYHFGLDPVKDVLENKTNFGIGRISLIVNRSKNDKIVLLYATFQTSPLVLAAKQSSNIKNLKDLKNKKISLSGTDSGPLIFTVLASEQVSKNNIKQISTPNKIQSLIDDEIDIGSFYTSNQIYILEKQGVKLNIFNPSNYGFDFYGDLLFTSEDEIENNPHRVKRFKEASLKGWRYAFNNIEETVDLILQKYNIQNKTKEELLYEAKILKQLAYKNNNKLGDIDKYRIQSTHNLYKLTGVVNGKLDIDKFIYKSNQSLNLTKVEQNYLKNKKNIKMCIDPAWMPLESFKNGQHVGITADYFELFKQNINLPIDVVKTKSWLQSLEYVQEHKCDILSLSMKTPQREEYLNFTTSYLDMPLVLATKNNITFISDFHTLTDEKIGITRGYNFKEVLKEKYPNLNLIEINNLQEGLQKVKVGELFGYVDTLVSIGYMFQEEFVGELKIAGKFDDSLNLSIAVRKDDKILLDIFDRLVQNLSDEQHKKILNKWVAIKYEQTVDYTIVWQVMIFIFILILFFIYRQVILKKANIDLKKAVEEKTKELLHLNQNLEIKIQKAVTDNRKKDQLLFTQTRLASMGEMIGNIAHQWRQPLSVISTGATGLKMQKEYDNLTDKFFYDACDSINDNAQYLSKTIDDFRDFVKGDRKKSEFFLNNQISSFLHLVEGAVKNNQITVIQDLQDDIVINGYENELIQCFLNIFNNAKDVLQEKDLEEKLIFIHTEVEDDIAIIKIKDNAGGISKEILPRIFEPYFTTKHKSKGTGLGLHMTYTLISEGMSGSIEADNRIYEYNSKQYIGAEFILTIPLH